VRAVARKPLMNGLQNTGALDQNLAIVEAQNGETELTEFICSLGIGVDMGRFEVLAAVNFHNQLRFDANEVCEIGTNGMLATEFVA
jgi:hypothetical protein